MVEVADDLGVQLFCELPGGVLRVAVAHDPHTEDLVGVERMRADVEVARVEVGRVTVAEGHRGQSFASRHPSW